MMDINWQKVSGLLPVIVQDSSTKDVLMLGYMNEEALQKTLDTGMVTFFSRTKNRLWTKGETSGNVLKLKSYKLDCDKDTLLVKAKPVGPTCHTGTKTCFGVAETDLGFLGSLEEIIRDRFEKKPEGSYISSLIKKGSHKMAQKVGEEGVEVALAAKDDDPDAFLGEAADLVFHLMVLLRQREHNLQDVIEVLHKRHQPRD